MADLDAIKETKEFYLDIPQKSEAFFLKGSNALGWGMQNRLASIFNPKTGRTVMLAFDHGYFQGATTGLERVDVTIMPLVPYSDTLMLTRGILRSIVPPSNTQAIVMRASGGSSMLKELSNEEIAVDIEGHPDNVAPALFGGMQIITKHNSELITQTVNIPKDLRCVLFIPEKIISTKAARKILPKKVQSPAINWAVIWS